jgi:hypothetical protein
MPSWRSGSPSSRGTESRGSDDDRRHREDTVGSSQGLSPCVNRILTNTRFHKRNVRAFNLIRPARCSFLPKYSRRDFALAEIDDVVTFPRLSVAAPGRRREEPTSVALKFVGGLLLIVVVWNWRNNRR